jgi:hypothetical protein
MQLIKSHTSNAQIEEVKDKNFEGKEKSSNIKKNMIVTQGQGMEDDDDKDDDRMMTLH